jgi:hypothetical protein
LIGEFYVAVSLLAPAFLYMYFRVTLTTARSYVPQISNLFDPSIYSFVIRSFIEQFGLFFFLFIGGCLLLLRNKDFTPLLYFVSVIVVILAFHIMDDKVYVGYSRFNLFILPAILAGSIVFILWAAKQKQYIGSLLIFVAIGSNLLFSPVSVDGVKKPYWGNYLADTSEHYYPYQDALVWLKNNYAQKRILFVGLDFYYPFQFYWKKLSWKPRRDSIGSEAVNDETVAMSRALQTAENEHYGIVVYRVINKNFVLPQETSGFRIQVIQNSAHALIIFYKP